jgi:hypothetical protein
VQLTDDHLARIRLLVCLVIAAFVCLAGALMLVYWLEPWNRPVLPGRAPQFRAQATKPSLSAHHLVAPVRSRT